MSDPSSEALAELSWLAELARHLVRDAHTAEDAVQDTLLTALSSRTDGPGRRRAWLATVLRRRLGRTRATEERRAEREALVARPEAVPPALRGDEIDRHRLLLEIVGELEEPYRTAVVRRFLRGLTPREIARQDGVPVKTVYTRIERALARLRERLDREAGGDRSLWLSSLLPLTTPRTASPWLATGGLWMTKAQLGSTVLLLLALGAAATTWSLSRERAHEEREAARPETELPTATEHGAPAAELVERPVRRATALPAATPTVPAEDPRPAPAPPPRVTGEVRDAHGGPVAGIRVLFRPDAGPEAREAGLSDGRGSFEVALPEESGHLDVASEIFVAVHRPALSGAVPPAPPVVVVAPRRAYSGRVVDTEGAPVASAEVAVGLEGSFVRSLPGFGAALTILNPLARTRSDAEGSFAIDVGFLEGERLEVERDGFRRHEGELPAASTHDLVVVLERAETDEDTLFGIVLDERGLGLPEAFVSVGGEAVHTDPGGRFAVTLAGVLRSGPLREGTLRAVMPGRAPAEVEFTRGPGAAGTSREDPLVVRLADEPLALAGRVVDAKGRPVAGALVWTPDTTYFGQLTTEGESGRMFSDLVALECVVRGSDLAGPGSRALDTRSGPGGAFALAGVLDRDYALLALDPATLALSEPVVARGGTSGLELRLEDGDLGVVAGRVTSLEGVPLGGVRIVLGRAPDLSGLPPRPDDSWAMSPLFRPPADRTLHELGVETDEEGRFRTRPVQRTGAFLFLSGHPLAHAERLDLAGLGEPEDLVLRLAAACRVRVVLEGDPTAYDAFARLAPDGSLEPLFLEVEGFTISAGRVELIDGVSDVVLLPEGTHTFALYRDGEEIERREVRVEPGGVHDLRL